MTPQIVIPAAGASSRMQGRDKLMEPVDHVPLLRRQCIAALATGLPVIVCLPPETDPRHAILADLPVTKLPIRDAAEGMGATLRTAARLVAQKTPDQPMMILLPDVPGIRQADIRAVLTEFTAAGGETVTRATDETARPGTPLIVPARLLPAFATLKGDAGGRTILRDESVLTVAIPGDRATRDLDTADDWAAWRKETGIET